MRCSKLALSGVLALALGVSTANAAPIVSLHSSNVGIGSMTFNVVGTTITIEEEWTSLGSGMLLIEGLEAGIDYTVNKVITNNTGTDWTALANELLDPFDQVGNDEDDDIPYPSYVPVGFSTSNDLDGLSFAQGSGIPRVSSVFSTVVADELAGQDFLDYLGGVAPNGGPVFTVSFGLRDNAADNQPFLLSQRPNQRTVVPEPAVLSLVGLGLALVARRFRKS